jgi:hypothetical protein
MPASASDVIEIGKDEDEDVMSMGGSDEEDEGGFPSLEDFLVTEDGDNIADGIVKAIDRVTRQLDTQNKIFIKMYSVLMKIAENSSTHGSSSKA